MTATDQAIGEIAPASRMSVGVGQAVRSHWILFILPVILLVVAGAVVGIKLNPTYSAEADLNVGRLDVAAQAIPGYAQAIQNLASAYARLATADSVVIPIAQKLRLSPTYVQSHVSASPVPDSPVFAIDSIGATPAQAIALANTATVVLAHYLDQINSVNPGAAELLSQYGSEITQSSILSGSLNAADKAYNTHPSPALDRARQAAYRAFATEQLLLDTTRATYISTQQGVSFGSAVQVLDRAGIATSNKKHHLEAAAFAGLVVGALLGLALAMWRATVLARRALSSRAESAQARAAPEGGSSD